MNKQKRNFLDYIPVRSEKNQWIVNGDRVTILMEHRGFYPWIAQRFFKKPRVSRIELDAVGSYIWQQTDGEKTVESLAVSLKEHFGEQVEPLYERLTEYMRILHQNGFIELKKPE